MCVSVICDEYKPLCLWEQQAYIPQHLDTSLTVSGRLLWCVGCHGCCRHVREQSENQEDEPKNTFRWQYWVQRRERYNGRIWEGCVCAECTINGFLRLSELSEHEAKLWELWNALAFYPESLFLYLSLLKVGFTLSLILAATQTYWPVKWSAIFTCTQKHTLDTLKQQQKWLSVMFYSAKFSSVHA